MLNLNKALDELSRIIIRQLSLQNIPLKGSGVLDKKVKTEIEHLRNRIIHRLIPNTHGVALKSLQDINLVFDQILQTGKISRSHVALIQEAMRHLR